ncbi:hypothetical protein [Pontixanthobacter sp. CEM42]|uniref:hypothetical protein n=1 Tax=Pontixanthobacter sp. CEM42 TaxID=2792077 RepID=UPI001ADEDC1A|nr:hypothetical protein [Pontixanthobacter sp. CEM42]
MRALSHLKATVVSASLVTLALPVSLQAQDKPLSVECIDSNSEVAQAPTEAMTRWLSSHAESYDRSDAFTISATGAMNRVFAPSGMLVHPLQMAEVVRRSSSFSGDKAKLVELGISGSSLGDTSSYADQLSAALDTEVQGCDGIAYYVNSGLYLCAAALKETEAVNNRLLPIGFHPEQFPMFMAFCVGKGQSPDPRTLLSSQAAYGLFPNELAELDAAAKSDAAAAFRLYQYYWIAKQDRDSALSWLEKSANLGSQIAQYNLAYELFESAKVEQIERANGVMDELVSSGARLPDLREFYTNSGETNE